MGDRETGPMSPETALMMLTGDPDRPGAPTHRLRAEAVQVLAAVVNPHLDGIAPERYVDATDDAGNPACWPFIGYRPDAAQLGKHSPDTLNAPETAQYQGVVFADGSVAMRWLTARRSTSVWETFADMFDVHGHPEYGTQIHWPNGAPQDARDAIQAAADAHAQREAERQAPETPSPGEVAYAAARQDWSAALPVDQIVSDAIPPAHQTYSTGEPDPNGNTLVVCLDCQGVWQGDHHQPMIVPFPERKDADSWLVVHRESNPAHVAVTVPGWPSPSIAIATARAHVFGRAR